MKFPLSWLRTHLDTDATPEAIAETLTRIGLELESLEHPGAALAAFRIARVLEAAQHPNADRLRVCKVDTGDGTTTVSPAAGSDCARPCFRSRTRSN
jgi:phenylalanyl-tRNA synthetase beta chain